jgi:uncharacterized membrane-anchored protein
MEKTFNKNYPFNLWINSILWSSFFLTIAFFLRSGSREDAKKEAILPVLLTTLLFGASFSWFIFLLCYFVFKKLPSANSEQRKKIKIILCLLAIGSMLGTCSFFGINLFVFSIELVIPFCYLLAIIIATLATKIELPNQN